MARIRTVKPEFWEDETIASLSRDARLLFIATFNMADDEGLLRWSAAYIKASAFMYDDDLDIADIDRLMVELVDAGLMYTYRGAGKAQQRLAFIVNFRKHQKINRPQPSKLPPPSLQNSEVRYMYGRRDGWVCHICSNLITQFPKKDDRFNLSIDHMEPRIDGGSDYPSNVHACHQTCNKRKGDRSLTDSVRDSVTTTVNRELENARAIGSRSRPEREGEGKGKGSGGGSVPAPLCAAHAGSTDAPPCRACGDARRTYDAWTKTQKERPTTTGLPPTTDAPRCAVDGHETELAEHCRICASERKSA